MVEASGHAQRARARPERLRADAYAPRSTSWHTIRNRPKVQSARREPRLWESAQPRPRPLRPAQWRGARWTRRARGWRFGSWGAAPPGNRGEAAGGSTRRELARDVGDGKRPLRSL